MQHTSNNKTIRENICIICTRVLYCPVGHVNTITLQSDCLLCFVDMDYLNITGFLTIIETVIRAFLIVTRITEPVTAAGVDVFTFLCGVVVYINCAVVPVIAAYINMCA